MFNKEVIKILEKDAKLTPKAANSVIGHVMKVPKGKFQSKEIVEAVRKELEKRP